MALQILDAKEDMETRSKIVGIERLRVFHPRMMTALRKIDECRSMVELSGEGKSLLIYGERGAGKSEIVREYCRRHGAVIHGKVKTRREILHGRVPSPAKVPALIEAMLEELGDQFPGAGRTARDKERRLRNLLRDCGVNTIILDEFQHLLNSSNHKVIKDVADWLKAFIIEMDITVILVGNEECIRILDANGQFERRTLDYEVVPFSYSTDTEKEEFRRLLDEIDKLLPFEEVGLSDEEYSDRFF